MYHNKVVICGVNTAKLKVLTEEEKQYMESIFPDSADFLFTHPSRLDSSAPAVSRAYRSKYAISWKNARTGLWCNYGFNIIEC